MDIIKKAATFAQNAHQGQKRKDGKEYFTHVKAVADIVAINWFRLIPFEAQDNWFHHRDHVIAAAYLHDTIEDCGVTMPQLINEGFSVMTAEIVEGLSRRPDETYFDFIMRIRDSGAFAVGVAAVKLADLEHNMSDLKEGSLKDKYRFAHHILSR